MALDAVHRFRGLPDAFYGDATVACLELILREEVDHVATGSHWFAYLCAQRELEPRATFRALLREYHTAVYPPFNVAARLAGGFSAEELAELAAARSV